MIKTSLILGVKKANLLGICLDLVVLAQFLDLDENPV